MLSPSSAFAAVAELMTNGRIAAEAVDDTKDRRVDAIMSSSSDFTLECRQRREEETAAAGPVWNAREAAGKSSSSSARAVLTMIRIRAG